jgi:16S rRNA (guanine1516-N2)-methyltransferase
VETILINHTDRTTQAEVLAHQFNLPIKVAADNSTRFILHLTHSGLSLQHNTQPLPSPVHVDFTSGKAAYRRGQSELLAKAIGLNKRKNLQIIDATAGLGKDAFVMATLGCKVTLIERHPLIHLLLSDGIERALNHEGTRESASKLSLIHADAVNWLIENPSVDVIYLDPMYPSKRKSAQAKKEMQLFQALLDNPQEDIPLLQAALQKARYRVVVKRPIKGAHLAGIKPDFKITGRSTRFDVYQTEFNTRVI